MGVLWDLAWPTILPASVEEAVTAKAALLDKRGFPLAWEHVPPRGRAGLWYQALLTEVPPSGRDVARQLARLAGDEMHVAVPWRSLADAVGKCDKAGNLKAYTERGAQVLVDAGWLRHEAKGLGRGSRTTWHLLVPPDRSRSSEATSVAGQ